MILTITIIPIVVADGVPGDAFRQIIGRHGFSSLANIHLSREEDRPFVLLMTGMSTERLGPAMLQPYRGYVEYRDDDEDLGGRILDAGTAHRFCLTVTTPTAFGMDSAYLVCNALEYRG